MTSQFWNIKFFLCTCADYRTLLFKTKIRDFSTKNVLFYE